MKNIAFLIFQCLLISQCQQYQEENGVIILNEANFDQAIKRFPFLIVEFFTSWCNSCQDLDPEYQKSALSLKSENIIFAKFDATEAKNLTSRLAIRSYPSLKFYRSGRMKNYDGKLKALDMTEWLHINAVPLITMIDNRVELELFKEQQKIVLIYFAQRKEKENDQKVFDNLADQCEGVYFGLIQGQELRQQLGLDVDEKIALYTPYTRDAIKMKGDITQESIKQFVWSNSYPSLFSYNHREKVFVEELKHPAIFLLQDKLGKLIPEEVAFNGIARKQQQNEIVFVSLNKAKKENREVLLTNKFEENFGINAFPCVFILDTRDSKSFLKYKLHGPINELTLTQFIKDFGEGNLKPYHKSQKVPIQKTDVRVVVGKSFQWEVIDNDKEVLVMFYAPWDQTSKVLQILYDRIASQLKKVNSNIALAKIDSTENEIPGYNFDLYPVLKYFKQGTSEDEVEVVDFVGPRTFEGIMQFLQNQTKFPWIAIQDETKNNNHSDL